MLAGLVARLLDCFHDYLQRFFVGRQVRGKAALVAHAGGQALVVQHFFQSVEDFRTGAQRFAEAVEAGGHNHEFLNVHRVIGVLAAVDDVHHWHRQLVAVLVLDVAVQGQALAVGAGVGQGQGNAQNGVGAEVFLKVVAVQFQHQLVQLFLAAHAVQFLAHQRLFQFPIDIVHGLLHALAAIAGLVPIAQFQSLAGTGGRARGHAGGTLNPVVQSYRYLHRGIAAGVKDFNGFYICNGCHG